MSALADELLTKAGYRLREEDRTQMPTPRPSILTVAILSRSLTDTQRIIQRPSTPALCIIHFRFLAFLISVLFKTISTQCVKKNEQVSLWHHLVLSSIL